jgi:hypothetical protein
MPDAPRRIQRSRAKGWRMPEGAVYVGRPSKWGNPFTKTAIINWHLGDYMGDRNAIWREEAREVFRCWATGSHPPGYFYNPSPDLHVDPCALDFSPLRGKTLACWCPLHQPCHADVLLEIANAPLRCEAADA